MKIIVTKNSIFDSKSAEVSIGINSYSPKSLTRQVNMGTSIQFRHLNSQWGNRIFTNGINISETRRKTTINHVALNAFCEYALYPNTRTQISFRAAGLSGVQKINTDNYFLQMFLYWPIPIIL